MVPDRHDGFDLNDFVRQVATAYRMRHPRGLLSEWPGVERMRTLLDPDAAELVSERLARWQAMIASMTPAERSRPGTVAGGRIARIARGSGTAPDEVWGLLKLYYRVRAQGRIPGRDAP